MRAGIKSISIIFFIFLISVVIAGCITPSGNAVSPSITIALPAQPSDFAVTISTSGLGNVTGTVTRNFSEIQSGNYRDIPVLLDLKNSTYCGYSNQSDYSAVARVALQNPRIREMLQEGGIVKGIYVWGPPSFTKEQSEHPCEYLYTTFELDYHGKGETALINATTNSVIMPPDVS